MKKEFKKLAVLVAILAMVLSAIPVSAKAQANPRITLYKQVRLENMSVTLGWFQPSADNVKFLSPKRWYCESYVQRTHMVTAFINLLQRRLEKP